MIVVYIFCKDAAHQASSHHNTLNKYIHIHVQRILIYYTHTLTHTLQYKMYKRYIRRMHRTIRIYTIWWVSARAFRLFARVKRTRLSAGIRAAQSSAHHIKMLLIFPDSGNLCGVVHNRTRTNASKRINAQQHRKRNSSIEITI